MQKSFHYFEDTILAPWSVAITMFCAEQSFVHYCIQGELNFPSL